MRSSKKQASSNSNDDFWGIVDRVHIASPHNGEQKMVVLRAELCLLSDEELTSFCRSFYRHFSEAYSWDLWAAAYIICGGCSDDGFMDFRASLIFMGHETFERAMANPETLVELGDDAEEILCCEGYQYVIQEVVEEKLEDMPVTAMDSETPSGESWQEEDLEERFPALWKKFDASDDRDSDAEN